MMKIEGQGANAPQATETQGPHSARAAEHVKAGRHDRPSRAAAPGSDRVEVSSDARLMTSAVRAADEAPAIRQDVVERARQKLLSGELGRDVLKLADRLIDSFLAR